MNELLFLAGVVAGIGVGAPVFAAVWRVGIVPGGVRLGFPER